MTIVYTVFHFCGYFRQLMRLSVKRNNFPLKESQLTSLYLNLGGNLLGKACLLFVFIYNTRHTNDPKFYLVYKRELALLATSGLLNNSVKVDIIQYVCLFSDIWTVWTEHTAIYAFCYIVWNYKIVRNKFNDCNKSWDICSVWESSFSGILEMYMYVSCLGKWLLSVLLSICRFFALSFGWLAEDQLLKLSAPAAVKCNGHVMAS